jgi:hypothetical protein
MSLLGNYSLLHKSPMSMRGGASNSQVRSNFSKSGSLKNSYSHFGLLASYPSGYACPYSWSMPVGVGAMSSFTDSRGTVYSSVNMAGAYNLSVTDSLTMININAQLDQIVSFLASSIMSVTASGQLNAAIQLQASAILSLVSTANIGAIVSALASSGMVITPDSALIALAHLNAEAGGPTPLSPEGIAQAVWNYLKANPTTTGSMKEVLEKAKQSADNAFAVSS